MADAIHPATLTVTYTHPSSSPYTLHKTLPPPPTPSSSNPAHHTNDPLESSTPEPLHTAPNIEAKTQHLKNLRKLVGEVQAEINVFLTGMMEEEKKLEAEKGFSRAAKAAEEMEKDGEVEEELDEETRRLEEEVERSKREEEAERKGPGKLKRKGNGRKR